MQLVFQDIDSIVNQVYMHQKMGLVFKRSMGGGVDCLASYDDQKSRKVPMNLLGKHLDSQFKKKEYHGILVKAVTD